MFSFLRNALWCLTLTAGAAMAQSKGALTQVSPAIYDNALMKGFLAQYLRLTEAQMVQMDLVFAQARAQLFPWNEKLKQTQTKINEALSGEAKAEKWKPLVAQFAEAQGKVLEVECVALVKFQALLDGDQRFKLTQLSAVEVTTNEQGQPVVAYQTVGEVQ